MGIVIGEHRTGPEPCEPQVSDVSDLPGKREQHAGLRRPERALRRIARTSFSTEPSVSFGGATAHRSTRRRPTSSYFRPVAFRKAAPLGAIAARGKCSPVRY